MSSVSNTTSGTQRHDLALAYREAGEQSAIQAATGISSYAIVTIIGGEVIELVTQCRAADRKDWRDLLGLNLAEDIDVRWGMAWMNQDGSVEWAGPDLVFAEQAAQNLHTYHFSEEGTRLTVENTDDYEAPFAFFGETLDGFFPDSVHEFIDVYPNERAMIGALHGVTSEDPWGMAWQPVSLPPAGKDGKKPQPEYHRIIVAIGSKTQFAHRAFRDLAVVE